MTSTTHDPFPLSGLSAVVTGGTGGIGAATVRRLSGRGARVVLVGRSRAKADLLVMESGSLPGPGSVEAVVADFSRMRSVVAAVDDVAGRLDSIDVLVHAVGTFLTRSEHTAEGVETDLAVSYLSRYVFLEAAHRRGLLTPRTRMVNIAASAPVMPRRSRTEFSDIDVVRARTGAASHGQAQTANDLLTAQAGDRYGVSALGYGPGNVDTGILRELPWTVRALFYPLTRSRRGPDEVAVQLLDLLADEHWSPTTAGFAGKRGRFQPDPFVTDPARQRDLLAVSAALADHALGA